MTITARKWHLDRRPRGEPMGFLASLLRHSGATTYAYKRDTISHHFTSTQNTNSYRAKHALRRRNPSLSLGAALPRAKALVELFGYTVPFACPAVWGDELFDLFLPLPSGIVDDHFLRGGAGTGQRISREARLNNSSVVDDRTCTISAKFCRQLTFMLSTRVRVPS